MKMPLNFNGIFMVLDTSHETNHWNFMAQEFMEF